MKRKLIATHDGQTFTRTTERTYTHIVVARNSKEKMVERAVAFAPISKRDFQCLVEITQGTYQHMQYVNDAERDRAAFAVQMGIEDYRKHQVEKAKAAYADYEPKWDLAGWCGRLDLAQKLASSTMSNQHSVVADVVIVPVNA